MSQAGETFFTSVGCMDGRSECTVAKWGRQKFGVKYADAITEAGLVGLLAQDNPDQALLDSLKKKILISVEKHHSENIVVSGHEDCAGNPVDEAKHKKDVLSAVDTIKKLAPGVNTIPVFVKREGLEWVIEEL